jgi:DNA helicase-2/ATP-dependent DNA helicase PcrA
MVIFGPPALGRGAVVMEGSDLPASWAALERVPLGEAELSQPRSVIAHLHAAWLGRRPLIVELGFDANRLRIEERHAGPVYGLAPEFEFPLERLQFLLWANNYDARSGRPIWWHAVKAARTLSQQGVVVGGRADVILGDGTDAYIDGGPPRPPELPDGGIVIHRWNAEAGNAEPVRHDSVSADLAPDQLTAVSHGAGPARIIAPAGSGKTRVLTERLRHLVVDTGAAPETVTALAFNVKAADEMKGRTSEWFAGRAPHIRTINSLAYDICNEFGGAGRLRVLNEMDARRLIEATFEIRRRSNADVLAPYLEALAAIRLQLTDPGVAEENFPDAAGIGSGFDRYRSSLAEAGALDFDEQIYRAIEILVTRPDARAAARTRCRSLLVDEFQDLNPAHLLLLRLLSAPGFDCFGVGDDDQVLYGYSGATPKFLIEFADSFPGATPYALETNYRCPPDVVDGASSLLSYCSERIDKVIRSARAHPDAAGHAAPPADGLVILREPQDQLATATVRTIDGWLTAGHDPTDMAVLARVNSALLPVLVGLSESGIACESSLTPRVLDRTGIRVALAYLRIGNDPDNIRTDDLRETIRRPSRRIAPNVIDMLTSSGRSSLSDVRRLAGRLTGGDVEKLQQYAADLEIVARGCAASSSAGLRAIRLEVGLGDAVDILDASRDEADRSTHVDDLIALESVASLHAEASTFETWLRSVLQPGEAGRPGVLLSTIHRIKGREWDRVIVFGVNQGLLPHRLSHDLDAERRVLHVGMTRARVQTILLADSNAPSDFLDEVRGARSRQVGPTPPKQASSEGAQMAHRPRSRAERRRREARRPIESTQIGASTGLHISRGGTQGEIVQVNDSGVVVQVGNLKERVSFGTEVSVEGKLVTLVPAREPNPTGAERLRGWRSSVSSAEKMPAYLVLSDKDLLAIADARPRTLSELADCRGIGPMKLERWGDEILAALDRE